LCYLIIQTIIVNDGVSKPKIQIFWFGKHQKCLGSIR